MLAVNYLDQIAEAIRREVSQNKLPVYAVLALAKGTEVSLEDVHNGWAAWMIDNEPNHESIKPFNELSADVKSEDEPYLQAIRAVADRL